MSAAAKKVRLRRLLLTASLRCFIALIVVVAVVAFLFYEDSRRSSEAYVVSIANSMDESLNLLHSTLETAGRYLSVYEPLARLHLTGSSSLSDLNSIFSLVELTVVYSDFIQDVAVVSDGGDVRSFYANYAGEYVSLLLEEGGYDFSETSLTEMRYFFFPDHKPEHDPMFLCLIPLIDTEPGSAPERVGTLAFTCRTSALESILELNLSLPYRCALVDASGREVAACAAGGYADAPGNHRATLQSRSLPLSIHVSTHGQAGLQVAPLALWTVCALLLFIVFLILYFSRVIRRNLAQPIARMVRVMPRISLQAQPALLPETGVDELDIIVSSVNAMIAQLEEASRSAIRMKTQLLETQLRKNEAELYALQSQINPHFLFNTLQCVRSLAILNRAGDVSTISSALSAILRYSIREMQQVSVREEMGIVEQYIKIIDIRHQKRIAFETDVSEDVLGCACPCMIVQPLVENAVIHGVAPLGGDGRVRIDGRLSGGCVEFEIADDGVGIDAEKLREIQTRLRLHLFDMLESNDRYGKSFGLLNIQRRIQLQYGEEYGLTVSSSGGWTRLRLRFPAVPFPADGQSR